MVEMETGSRIPIWRTVVFQLYFNRGLTFGLRRDVDLRKIVTSSNTKPEVVLRSLSYICKINKRAYRPRGWSDSDEIW